MRRCIPFFIIGAVVIITACTEMELLQASASRAYDNVVSDKDPETSDEIYRQALDLREQGANAAAFVRFQEAAKKGHPAAAYELGKAYNDGLGVRQNLSQGAQWINRAATLGNPGAQYLIGATHFSGVTGKKDFKQAVQFLSPAAVNGHARAQYLLAQAFGNGWGVAKDPTWAARWYGKAARQGHGPAQFSYGVIHATGLGLPLNRIAAYAWLTLAIKNDGDAKAPRVRDAIGDKMGSAAIDRAMIQAAGFTAAADSNFSDPPTVIFVQHTLNRLGFDAGPVDGVIGGHSRQAIRAFQKDRNLQTDGVISPQFLQLLLKTSRQG